MTSHPHQLLNTAPEIIAWLDSMEIKNYTLIPSAQYGFVVDVMMDVNLRGRKLNSIPMKFNHVKGNFYCDRNNLTSLLGAPQMIDGSFECEYNLIETLTHCPQTIGLDFRCDNNQLTSLESCPEIVAGDFRCSYNHLTSLLYGPNFVGGNFYCNFNRLTSLQYAPMEIHGVFDCSHNLLRTLEFCPRLIEKDFNGYNNSLDSLAFFPQSIQGHVLILYNPLLGDSQNIIDFDELHQLHINELIQIEKNLLTQNIDLTNPTTQSAASFLKKSQTLKI